VCARRATMTTQEIKGDNAANIRKNAYIKETYTYWSAPLPNFGGLTSVLKYESSVTAGWDTWILKDTRFINSNKGRDNVKYI